MRRFLRIAAEALPLQTQRPPFMHGQFQISELLDIMPASTSEMKFQLIINVQGAAPGSSRAFPVPLLAAYTRQYECNVKTA